MFHFPVGVLLKSLQANDVASGLVVASEMGFQGVQITATQGEVVPTMSRQEKRKLLQMTSDLGLTISALVGDFGIGFDVPDRNPQLIENSKRILDLAKELDVNIVTTHIGVVPVEKQHPRYAVMQDACGQLAEYADSLGAHFAIETGPEIADVLKEFLDSLHSRGVAVNLDPANFAMVTQDNPVRAVSVLRDYIVHVHAKDGVNLYPVTPEEVYLKGIDYDNPLGPAFDERPIGQGSVDFPGFLQALSEIDYKGFLTIERESGKDRRKDIRDGANYLRKIMGVSHE